jgi:hypothetical protein
MIQATMDTGVSSTFGVRIDRIACLPCNLITNVKPAFYITGTSIEQVVLVKNVEGCHGKLFAGRVLDEMMQQNKSLGMGCTDTQVLHTLADQLLEYIRTDARLANVPLIHCRQNWQNSWVGIVQHRYSMDRHFDGVPGGSPLLIFSAGLSCHLQVWPGSKPKDNSEPTECVLDSDDVLIFDGGLTYHAVQGLGCKSPFVGCPWLCGRRLSILVRQAPPQAMAQVFKICKHRGRTFQEVFNLDRGYCRWALGLTNVDSRGDVRDFIAFLKGLHGAGGLVATSLHGN